MSWLTMVFYLNPRCAVTVVSVVCCFYRLIMQFFRNGILPQQILGESATWKSLHIQPWKRGASHWRISTQFFKAGYQGLWDSWANLNTFCSRDCRQVAGESSNRASALSSYRNLWIMCSYLPGCSAAPGFRKIWKISGCLAFQVACEFLEAHLPSSTMYWI